jgi:opacity protein-like surface antigen
MIVTDFRSLSRGTLGALVLTFALASAASSQESSEGEMGRGFFQAGYMGLDLNGLNASLDAADYPSLDSNFVTLGGAGYGNQGRFLIGGEGHAILGSEKTTSDGSFELSAGGGYGLFRIGYLAYSQANLDLFPTIGIGGGAMSVSIKERSAPTFDQVLEDPSRSSELSNGMFLLDLSLAANYRILVATDDDEGEGGLLLGLQAGYTFSPGNPSWELNGLNKVAGGPSLEIEGAHVRLSLGGWGREAVESPES